MAEVSTTEKSRHGTVNGMMSSRPSLSSAVTVVVVSLVKSRGTCDLGVAQLCATTRAESM